MLKSILMSGILLVGIFGSTKAFAQAADAADQASKSQSGAQMASQMMGAALMPTCAMQPMPPTCPMGILSMIQAGMLGGSSKGAANAAAAMSSGSGVGASANAIDTAPTAGGSLDGGSGSSVASGKAELAKLGYSLSDDNTKMTLPNGKTIPTGSFATSSGMSAAGFSEGQIQDALGKMAEVQGKIAAKLKSGVLDGGGEGGGGGGAGSLTNSSGGSGSSYVFRMGGKKAGAPNVSGMTKNFGDAKIGVAGDDIFEMITRRYKSQDQGNGFFKN
jgi:hypothetical protein